jgi:hypothetical protein
VLEAEQLQCSAWFRVIRRIWFACERPGPKHVLVQFVFIDRFLMIRLCIGKSCLSGDCKNNARKNRGCDSGDRRLSFGSTTDTPIIGVWPSAASSFSESAVAPNSASDNLAVANSIAAPAGEAPGDWLATPQYWNHAALVARALVPSDVRYGLQLRQAFGLPTADDTATPPHVRIVAATPLLDAEFDRGSNRWWFVASDGLRGDGRSDMLFVATGAPNHTLNLQHHELGIIRRQLMPSTRWLAVATNVEQLDPWDPFRNASDIRTEALDAVFALYGRE